MKAEEFMEQSASFLLIRLVGVPSVTTVLTLGTYMSDIHLMRGMTDEYTDMGFLLHLILSFFGGIIISEVGILIYRYLDRVVPWESGAMRRSIIQFGILSVATSIIASCLIGLYSYVMTETISMYETVVSLLMALIISKLYNAAYTGMFLFQRWKASLMEQEKMKQNQLAAELTVLRQQLDPHFLFNSLNVLVSMIEEQPKEATEFVLKLSRIYRYVLQVRNYDVVSLEEELRAAEAYIFLLKARFGDAMSVVMTIPQSYYRMAIPPLTLQLLLENAVKHNICTQEHPLYIDISVEEGGDIARLVVGNVLQRRDDFGQVARAFQDVHHVNQGIGLENIRRRYLLLGTRYGRGELITVDSDSQSGRFSVSLPLLEKQL